KDPLDLLAIQIEGSGRVILEDGTPLRIIRDWMAAYPEEAAKVRATNRSYAPSFDSPVMRRHIAIALSNTCSSNRFYQHKGIDERGLTRAFIGNLAASGRPQGGSTITQQIVKNLLVGDDLTYERKIREMILASRVEHALSKGKILELYLNSVYLGR